MLPLKDLPQPVMLLGYSKLMALVRGRGLNSSRWTIERADSDAGSEASVRRTPTPPPARLSQIRRESNLTDHVKLVSPADPIKYHEPFTGVFCSC